MSSVIKKLIGEITELAVQVTNNTKHDVFVDYRAHINTFAIIVHIDGWDKNRNPKEILRLSLNWDDEKIKKLKQTKRKLKKLLEEK
jgi:hypothetical protein